MKIEYLERNRRIEKVRDLMAQGIFNYCGDNNNLVRAGGVLNKYSKDNSSVLLENNRDKAVKEYEILNDLCRNGINAPQAYAVELGKGDQVPVIAIEEKKITPISELDESTYQRGEQEFSVIKSKLENLGYETCDFSYKKGQNVAWDNDKESICIYDVEFWTGPRVDELLDNAHRRMGLLKEDKKVVYQSNKSLGAITA